MDTIAFNQLIMAFSLATLLAIGPISGTLSLLSVVLWFFESKSISCTIRRINGKITDCLESSLLLLLQFALITVLTPTIFLKAHAYDQEPIQDVFGRLTLNLFPSIEIISE